MISFRNRGLSDEQMAEIRRRDVEIEWSSDVVRTHTRMRGCFYVIRDIALLIEIVPSLIGIFLAVWFLGVTAINATLSDSDQLHYPSRVQFDRNNTDLNETCEPEPMLTSPYGNATDNVNATDIGFCIKDIPISDVGTGNLVFLGIIIIVECVTRMAFLKIVCHEYPEVDAEMVAGKYFVFWAFSGLFCMATDYWGYTMLSPLGNHDVSFINDYYLFYYLYHILEFYLNWNFIMVLASRMAMLIMHAFSNSTEVYIYA